MNRSIRHLASAIAISLGAVACTPATPVAGTTPAAVLPTFEVPAPATSQQLELAGRQVEELDRMLALDARCDWLDPAARAALEATAAERRAWLTWQNGEPAAPQPANVQCSDQQIRDAVRYGTWQMRVTWALRGHALLADGDGTPWQSGLSRVETQRAVLQETSDGLEERYGSSIQQARPDIRKEAQLMLASRCRTGAEAATCPALADDPAFAQYAETWLAQAEAYAAILAKVDDRIGTPPSDD